MRILWRMVFNLLRWGWHLLNFIREFILNIFLVVLVVIVGIYLEILHTKPVPIKSALVMNLTGTVVDKPTINNKVRKIGRELLGMSSNQLQENSLFDLVDTLRKAKGDANISGLVLSLKDFAGTDQGSLQYIGKALCEFRNSGKPIYAIGDSYSQAQYFLASYANKIYLTPQGVVDLHGIATNNLYYKTLLNKLKVNSYIFRVGKYKSVVEPFLRNNMSNNAREADSRWVYQLWRHYLTVVAANRKITPQQLFPSDKAILNGLRTVHGNTAQFALNNKWVDEVKSRSAINDTLIKTFGWNKRNNTFNGISIYDYQSKKLSQHGGKIAVIFANGTIIDGQEIPGSVGSDTIANQIRDARLNSDIKAILFRVNSPGGSVTASETIRSELATVGKPVVVSMGGIAASGGYWISTPANYIIANDSTLTGSIGIFGIINTIENSLKSIGIHTDGITTSQLANVSMIKTLPLECVQMMQLNVENGYNNFINLVAQSRHKTTKEVNKISQGHIWTGSDASQNGLVDQVGDFDDAVSKAAELAQLKQYQLKWYLGKTSLLDLLTTQTSALAYTVLSSVIQSWLPAPIAYVIDWLKMNVGLEYIWNDPKNLYALCLSCEREIH